MSARDGHTPGTLVPYLLILCATVMLAAAPQWINLPIPRGAVALTQATVSLNGQPEQTVMLPHRWPRSLDTGPARATYHVTVDRMPWDTLYLLVPAAQHTLTVTYGGLHVPGSELRPWGVPTVGSAYMLALPSGTAGSAVLEITLERGSGSVAGYLSKLYLADETQVARVHWIWAAASGGSRVAVAALQALVVLGITTVWLARRHDPIFGWLFLIGSSTFLYTLADFVAPQFFSVDGQSYLVFTLASFGLMVVGLAMAIMGVPRPRWLKLAIVALPAILMAFVACGILPPFAAAVLGSAVAIGGHLVAAGWLFRNSLAVREWDRALLAVPFFLTGWYGLRDIGIIVGAVDGVLLLTSRIRPLTIIAILTLLMRRLASSLDELDDVNDTLRQKLAAQQEELSSLHAKERVRAAQAAREDERERLMRDLHDGLSGHLVSIIALSETDNSSPKAIERAARAALDDLRLVINSLDLDDGDLLLALAGLRERLEPQLRRLGVELEWSMEKLPQVSGITPGNALSILRILQEAITNALKHGQKRRIAVEGSVAEDDWVTLTVRNDTEGGRIAGTGHGVANMKRRAEELGGALSLDIAADHALLTLFLPLNLADGCRSSLQECMASHQRRAG